MFSVGNLALGLALFGSLCSALPTNNEISAAATNSAVTAPAAAAAKADDANWGRDACSHAHPYEHARCEAGLRQERHGYNEEHKGYEMIRHGNALGIALEIDGMRNVKQGNYRLCHAGGRC